MKFRSGLVCLATLSAAVTVALSSPPASAFTESTAVLVTNQYGGVGCQNQQLLLANPFTGALVDDLDTPNSQFGVFNDAKPYDLNRRIVAIWGGSSQHSQLGGVGVYDRAQRVWTTSFALPTDFERGANSAHSIAVLPDGYFAVAHVGTIGGVGNGYVVVFSPTGTKVQQVGLASAHGVEWDAARGYLFAVGMSHVKKYSYATGTHTIAEVASWPLPTSGGHDLRRRRVDNDYFVTTNSQAYVFRPDTGTFTTLTKSDGTAVGGGVKSIDQRFDGVTEYNYYEQDYFYFTDRSRVQAQFCTSPYKAGRWIWAPGEKVYPEDATAPPPASSAPVDPFVWAQDLVKPTTTSPVGKAMWVGAAAWADKEAVKKDLAARVARGETPYVYFYQFGDNGSPPMGSFQNASSSQIAEWELFGKRIAEGIGSGNAYVVIEPEYDANLTAACTSKYKDPLKRIINTFKTVAPNARVVNGPGLWKSDSAYSCFADAAAQFHYQGFLHHVVSNDPDCTWRTNGTSFTGGKTLSEALKIVQHVRDKAARVKRLFGGGNVFLTDLAVTRCGWGDSGQAQIFANLVDALPSLYDEIGLRGVPIRNGGPAESERYLGVNNEGMFDYTGKPGQAEVDRGRTVIQNHLAAISSATTPTFRSAASAPANVAPGGSAPITVTVTNTGGSLSNGVVDIEVKDGAGNRLAQRFFEGQSFANGASRDYQYTWTASSTPGTYKVHVGVFSATWATQYHWNANAATINVGTADPAFTSSATATPASVAPGGTTTVTATLTNTGGALTNGVVDVAIHEPAGTRVAQKRFTGQNVAAGASSTYSMSWVADSTAGTYSIRVAVSGADGTPTYHSNGEAGTVTVSPATFTSTASPSPTTVAPGGTTNVTVVVEAVSGSVDDGIVDLEFYDEAGARVGQTWWSGQDLAAGTSRSYSYTWTVPTTTGSYTVKVGVFTTGWANKLHWNGRAAVVGVTPPKFETAASASPAKVAPGATTAVTVNVTSTGGTLTGAIVDVEIYNSAGTRVAQNWWSNQTLTHGTTRTYSWNWTAPSTTGAYTTRVGVFGPNWTPTHHWNANADQVVVAAPAFTSSADVSSSSAIPGSVVTITATFTNTGGALVNGVTDIEVYDAGGTRIGQRSFTGQSIADGAAATYSYDWTTPLTTGTYTVKLGVFGANWTPTHHWNNNAGTVSVGSTFQPSFRIGSGANTWWIEVYTSSDVTGVDVIGRDGAFYMSLPKKSWGAWAASPPSELLAGRNVMLVARRATDGATAASNTFGWLTGTPTTQPGWACTFTLGANVSTTWIEVYLTPDTATSLEAKVGSGAWFALTRQTWGSWAKATSIPAGSKVVVRATRADGARAYSPIYTWLQ